MNLPLRARVHRGRLVLDEPIDLPEGSEVDLVLSEEHDNLDDAEHARLHASLARARDQVRAGATVDKTTLLDRLDARR